MKINEFTEDSPYAQIKRWASKNYRPAQYEKAAQTLHDVLVRKVRETNGKLRHGLGYYAQQVGKSFYGVDTTALVDVYKDMYGAEGLAEFKIVKPDPKDTMGVKRTEMPQIATDDYPAFMDYLKDNGATFSKETVPAKSLKAIQGEFSDQGVEKALRKRKLKKASIVSSDNYIIDGHHRWIAALNTGADVDIIRVNMPGKQLLKLVKNFDKTTYKDIYTERLVKLDKKGPKNLKVPQKMTKYAKRKAMLAMPDDLDKLKEDTKPHLFLDMDGVQADFFNSWAKWHSETTGKPVNSYRDIGDAEAQLASIMNMTNQGPEFVKDFFANLPPLNGFGKVLNWIKSNNIPFSILSAPLRGNNKASIEGKKQWLSKHNPGAEQEIFTGNKENYATSGGQANVLIDDHGKYIQRWTSKGGIGVKHSNANPQATIDALEQIYNLNEGWSAKYKRSIDCSNPKGFSQKAHCAGRKKTEAFDNPYKLDYDDEIEGFDQSMYVQLPDKTYLHITFNNEGNNQWVVEFYRDHTQELTGQGDAQRIFATVIDAIQKFIKKEKPASIDFSADKMVEPGQNAESRAKLYNSLVKRYAGALGYDSKINDQGDHVTYTLKRRKDVAENFKDGKKPGRKGLAKRSGVDCTKSITDLRKIAKNSSGERQRMAHWCANMKSGRKK